VKVLEVVDEHYSDFNLILDPWLFGGFAIDAVGEPLPPSTLKACQEADAILMGAQLFQAISYSMNTENRFHWRTKMGC